MLLANKQLYYIMQRKAHHENVAKRLANTKPDFLTKANLMDGELATDREDQDVIKLFLHGKDKRAISRVTCIVWSSR